MGQETARSFFKQVEEDQSLREGYKSLLHGMVKAGTDEAAAAQQVTQFASQNGYAFAAEDLKGLAAEMQGGELTNEELEAVAGGALTWVIVTGGSSGMACFIVGYEK
jgi:lactobin A/cerein 7B family class IIb bacteriocin